jgi:hypothetical protein
MSQTEPSSVPPYEDVSSAPTVYFDVVACNGIMNGTIQIELAQRILTPSQDGGVGIKFATSGRLRCSPAAAQQLIVSLQNSLKMLEQPQQESAAASKLN